jgi:UDP-N-acetylglucosamine 4-epimerase
MDVNLNQLYNISDSCFLITGGAGFIGSNLAEYLLLNNAKKVRVLDNLSNGYFENVSEFINDKRFEFVNGDIRSYDTCFDALDGIDYVSHQAALGSVPRSINDPITSNDVNISGFLNLLTAVKNKGTVKRMIYAASSSTYGDSSLMPKVEGFEGNPLSPYAVTKLVNELYGEVFSKVYGLHTIGLRYFNVFGPKQNPDNPYAAVIPLFIKAAISNEQPNIFGDGLTSRDFTYVSNAVQANIKALFCETIAKHEVINVACGENNSLLRLWDILKTESGCKLEPIFSQTRKGDIFASKASIVKAKNMIGYEPEVYFDEGVKKTYQYNLEKKNF